MAETSFPMPQWLREFDRNLSIRTQFYLYGNIYDKVPYGQSYANLLPVLRRHLTSRGYQLVGFYDIADGLTFDLDDQQKLFDQLVREVKADQKAGVVQAMRAVLKNDKTPTAFVIDWASLLCGRPNDLVEAEERILFTRLAKAAQEATSVNIGEAVMLNNLLVLVTPKLNDLPPWLYLNNPLCQVLSIERPTEEERRRYFDHNFQRFYEGQNVTGDRASLVKQVTDLTHGMMYRELSNIIELSKREHLQISEAKKLLHLHKFGLDESPWTAMLRTEKRADLEQAEAILTRRVKGQPAAIRAVVDIIKRASQGLSGVQYSSKGHKPKGILFFAGPTGVGKTELAKALAALMFGDQDACIRFDMSEYAQPHSDEKFFGAPPGYIGYEEGGQLTNKVKANPFSVLLFDEIEKAHPSVMDKFLQILEDGRLTSGQGETVYFSECLIIFTSNKGMYSELPLPNGTVARTPNVRPEAWRCKSCGQYHFTEQMPAECQGCRAAELEKVLTPYSELRSRLLPALERFFKLELGRPEIYNRFGNNFVVFDFIRPDVMAQIVERMLDAIRQELLEKRKIDLNFGPVRDYLWHRATANLEQGGRGVGNMLETVLVNPLARKLFEEQVADGTALTVTNIQVTELDGTEEFTVQWVRSEPK